MKFPMIKTRPMARIDMPVQFARLRDIAYNLWWSWSPAAQSLFEFIDPPNWSHYRNPIEILIDLEPQRWHLLQNDPGFIREVRALVNEFDLYMAPEEPTWFDRRFPDFDGSIAYFSTEFGWHESLQSYSGGLGILSGDHSKSASDQGLPFLGIGLMYRRGYFRQTVDADGRQQHFYPHYDVYRIPVLPVVDHAGGELRATVELNGRSVALRAWKARVGRLPVLLLDTDVSINHPADRSISQILYISGREARLCQELILGIGGVRVLQALGITPKVWHMNEGHSALLSLERLAGEIQRNGMSLDDARRKVASDTVFTTHTPVPAGNESFEPDLARKYVANWTDRMGVDTDAVMGLARTNRDDDHSFNLTALAVRTSRRVNGVSELHGRVAGEMWNHLLEDWQGGRVEHITNGVHLRTWIGSEIDSLLKSHLGKRYADELLDPGFAAAVEAIPDQELWEAHNAQKRRLIGLARGQVRRQLARHGQSPDELRRLDDYLDPDALIVGFARRFATYKRADLLLRDMERMKQIAANPDRPIQFVYAGKAHPADKPGQELIARIFHASRSPELYGRLVFLEDYDIRVGRGLVQGVDVWLNNPRRPLEASGTSGMKAALNGALNVSVLDGWWCEGYDPEHGWTLGEDREADNEEQQDQIDAESLYSVFGDEVAPCFYDRDAQGLPVAWIRRMKLAIGRLSPRFSTDRMVREYTEQYYHPLSRPEGVPAAAD